LDKSLSQAEIDALLKGIVTSDIQNAESEPNNTTTNTSDDEINFADDVEFTPEEIDALGEIGNISIGTSATTLFTLLRHKVVITTPKVSVTTWKELAKEYPLPYVAVRVEYTSGLKGINLLILKESDVKIITDLMMGGDGNADEGELNELHLSAISEAMNQMIGSAATSMSSIFNKTIEISPPSAFIIKFNSDEAYDGFNDSERIVKISFKMEVGNMIDSEIMQLLPVSFAKSMVKNLFDIAGSSNTNINENEVGGKDMSVSVKEVNSTAYQESEIRRNSSDDGYRQKEKVNVQPAHFPTFDGETKVAERQNIDLVMDVPLQVTVELGKTEKLIKDILEFTYGTIIELDKLAGDPVDIVVNGKKIARGEVVVIDDSFGVRITDIVDPSKRF